MAEAILSIGPETQRRGCHEYDDDDGSDDDDVGDDVLATAVLVGVALILDARDR